MLDSLYFPSDLIKKVAGWMNVPGSCYLEMILDIPATPALSPALFVLHYVLLTQDKCCSVNYHLQDALVINRPGVAGAVL